MEPENRGFIDTATSIAQTTASAVKTVTNAMSGNYVGAVISAAQSPFFRKLVACICAFIIFLIIVVCSLPTMLWNALMGGDSAYAEAQLRILNMASQINAVFLDDYNIELQELKELGVATGDITTNEPVPPISPYKIMAYYSVASLNKNNETDDSPSADDAADTPDVITGGIRIGTRPLSETVEAYRSTVKSAAEKYGIPQYVDILLAMMMQESGGRGNDVMQAAGSGYVYGAVTPSSSIDGGVHYFSECLKKAGCTGTQDWSRLEVAVQSYNYGMVYATWLKKYVYTGWTATNAAQYSNYMVKKYQANGSHISRYGDKQYIPHVFRYYHSSGGRGRAFDKFDIESEFQNISLGGAISYVEIPNMQNNLPALETLVKYIYDNIQYGEFNTKSDYCQECGFDGEIMINDNMEWECPQCHNKDHSKLNVTRRTCGYLGENFWNTGKTKEIKSRVLHL